MLDPKSIGPSEEQWEFFERKQAGRTKQYCQYDYRDGSGELFSIVKPTLEQCRNARDEWKRRVREHAEGGR